MIIYLQDTIKMFKELDSATLEAIRISIFVLIVLDVIGIYWFFGLKRIAIAILMVSMLALVLVLLLERRKQKPMAKQFNSNEKQIKELEEKLKKLKKENNDSEDSDYDDENDGDDDLEFALPSAEEYNKRLEKSYGSMGF